MQINFNADMMIILKVILALIMLGVSLDIKVSDIKNTLLYPKSIIVGFFGQFIFLPVLTYGLIVLMQPHPSVAMGLIIVAACPGGNVSNFFTSLAKGNSALSVSLTFIATITALFMTPFNISFWGGMYGPTSSLVKEVALNPSEVMQTIFIVLGIPLVLGLAINHRYEKIARVLQAYLKHFSTVCLVLLIVGGLIGNYKNFLNFIGPVVLVVFLQNFIALSIGFITSSILKLPNKDKKAITIEIGIQNSALALALAFEFFPGVGGVALICAWWGVWHAISGSIVTYIFSKTLKD
jgi:BASS family bile acid:Na+ symporter